MSGAQVALFIAFVVVATLAQGLTGFAFVLVLLGLAGLFQLAPVTDLANVATTLAVLGAAGAALKGGGLGEALAKSFSGARADGGPVLPGGSYLVGERGPEVFRPASAGSVEPAGGGISVTVNVQGGEASSLLRSDAQIAQALARAVSLGARRL